MTWVKPDIHGNLTCGMGREAADVQCATCYRHLPERGRGRLVHWLTWTVRLSMALVGALFLFAATSAPCHATAHQDCLGAQQARIVDMAADMQAAVPMNCGARDDCHRTGLCHSGDCVAAPIVLVTPAVAIAPRRRLPVHFLRANRVSAGAAMAFDPPPPRLLV